MVMMYEVAASVPEGKTDSTDSAAFDGCEWNL